MIKADVEMQMAEDGSEDIVYFCVKSVNGNSLTGSQIIEAIAEAVLMHWPNLPLESWNEEDFNS